MRAAGFNETTFPRLGDIRFVTEPEAAAIYTTRYLRDTVGGDVLRVSGNGFMYRILANKTCRWESFSFLAMLAEAL